MYEINIDKSNKYYSLYFQLRGEILRGKLKRGSKLPSKRALAEELGVSVTTVMLAYEQLLAEGYITSRPRSGYFVEEVIPAAPPPRPVTANSQAQSRPYSTATSQGQSRSAATPKKYRCDLVKANIPAHMFPFSTWARLNRLVLADCGEHLLERVPCDGDGELKQALSDYLYRSRGIDADPQRIVIGAGAEHLYGVIVQLLGRDKLYAVENPGYGKISATYALNGASWVAVDVGERGMDLEKLSESGAHVAHISPSHQFPTGAVTPIPERLKIIEWAESVRGYVIEDDYDSEFRLAGKPLQSMQSLSPDRVVYMNTFSKSLAPSMRLGYMVLPPELYQRYVELFSSSASIVPLFEQKTLSAMLSGGYFERHLSRLKNYYRGVRKLLLENLSALGSECEVKDTGSGLHLIAKFPSSSDEEIKAAAEAMGVNLKCLSDYLLSPMEGISRCAVINYSGLTEKDLLAPDTKK